MPAKTKIEWCDYTINPVKGLCPVACSYCYARRMYLNPFFRNMYDHQDIRYDPNVMIDTGNILKPSKIFVGSTMELFGDWVKPEWMASILGWVKTDIGIHSYIFLTKRPENLARWSPFPPNCWVGVSATNAEMLYDALDNLRKIKATVKFISFEPLLERVNGGECDDTYRLDGLQEAGIGWVIIGQQTPVSEKTRPNPDWIREIITSCNAANIPVFIKDNIIDDPVLDLRLTEMRQEFPITGGKK